MTRALLTGMGGFIGHHVMDHLLAHTDWTIVGLDSFRHKGTTDRITDSETYQRERARVTVVTHDLAAPIPSVTMRRIGEVDYIVNLASESHVDRGISDPVPFVHNNVALAVNMLEYARAVGCAQFIQVSTDEVYGAAPSGTAFHEWDTILPSNPYSASKAAQEALAIAYWRTYGVPVVITNTMNNFGERQDPEKFVPKTIKACYEGTVLPVHHMPGTFGSRSYLHARNHADAILWLLLHRTPARYPRAERPDRYNVVGERELENLELAQMIARLMDRELHYELIDFHTARPGHDLRYALDGTKLARLGWRAPFSFEDSLRYTVNWTCRHLEWIGAELYVPV